jgi:hypothetical protein
MQNFHCFTPTRVEPFFFGCFRNRTPAPDHRNKPETVVEKRAMNLLSPHSTDDIESANFSGGIFQLFWISFSPLRMIVGNITIIDRVEAFTASIQVFLSPPPFGDRSAKWKKTTKTTPTWQL